MSLPKEPTKVLEEAALAPDRAAQAQGEVNRTRVALETWGRGAEVFIEDDSLQLGGPELALTWVTWPTLSKHPFAPPKGVRHGQVLRNFWSWGCAERVWVQSLFGELRPHKPCSAAKSSNKKTAGRCSDLRRTALYRPF